jgi:hypothetical protein
LWRRGFGRPGPVNAHGGRYEYADDDAFGTVVATTEFRDSYGNPEPHTDRDAQRFRNADAHCDA